MELLIVFQQILNLQELIVTDVKISENSIDIDCCSIFEEAICPCCLKKQNSVNQEYTRKVCDLPISGKKVFLHIKERQFYCPDCNRFFSERFSFVEKNGHFTDRFEKHLFLQIKQSSINQVIAIEDLCWKTANDIIKRQSKRQLNSTSLFDNVRYIGMDEFALKKGHKNFATVIVDLGKLCIIDVLPYREMSKLIAYFRTKGQAWCAQIQVFCSDMWDGFITTAKTVFPNAEIVVDRFHFFKQINHAVDNQRKALRKEFKEHEELKYIKYLLLMNYSNLDSDQRAKLDKAFEIVPILKDVHTAKEDLRKIFEQDIDKQQAEKKIDEWTEKVKMLNNKYLNIFIKTLTNWKSYVLNYFTTRLTTSIIEGMNNKIKMIKRLGFGFTNFTNFKIRIMIAFE